jgi:hypothetical protein
LRRSSLLVASQIIGREVNIGAAYALLVGNRRVNNVIYALFVPIKRHSFERAFAFSQFLLLLALLFNVSEPIFG